MLNTVQSLAAVSVISIILLPMIFTMTSLLIYRRSQEKLKSQLNDLLGKAQDLEVPTEAIDTHTNSNTAQSTAPQSVAVKDLITAQQLRFSTLSRLVDSYHDQALGQAMVQFRVSVTAAVIGFALIIYGGFMQITSSSSTTTEVILGILPGVVIDAVAYLFFQQAERTRTRATELYDRLRADQRDRQALEIADGIADSKLRSFVYAQMSLHIVGLKISELDIRSVLEDKLAAAEKSDGHD
jgi:gas vesicle protein